MNTPPAFQFYAERFVAGTDGFTVAEVGAYILLLCYQWRYGAVPGDSVKRLAPIMRVTSRATAESIWSVLSGKFTKGEDGQWRNAKLEEVRAEQDRFRARQKANGSQGGRPKQNPKQTQKKPTGSERVTKKGQNQNPEITSQYSDLRSGSTTESKNDSVVESGKPHPIRDFLARHQKLFLDRYGEVPAKYTEKDAKHVKDFLKAHPDRALALLEQFFASRDSFIASSGHGLGVLAAGNVQNKLIAELSGRAPRNDGRDWAREFVTNG